VEEERVELVSRDNSAERLDPADRAFDDPSLAVAAERSAVLGGGAYLHTDCIAITGWPIESKFIYPFGLARD
jgi:hypothetical protein